MKQSFSLMEELNAKDMARFKKIGPQSVLVWALIYFYSIHWSACLNVSIRELKYYI